MKRVLVIVVTHNGMRWLSRCLGSVLGTVHEGPTDGPSRTLEVGCYVWDNDSTDGSADFVAAHFPQARLVRSADNLGFSRSNNMGVRYALEKGYDYVYLLNQDAWLEVGALDKLVAFADTHPQYGVLSPLQMTDGYMALDQQFARIVGPGPILSAGPGPRNMASSSVGGTSAGPGPGDKSGPGPRGDAVIDVDRVMAAHWLVPTRVIREIGPLEEELFPHWGQDDEWCQILHFCGYKVGVLPEARAVHDRAQRKDSTEVLVRRNYFTGSLLRLCDARYPLWLTFLYVILFTFVKAFKYRTLLPFKEFRHIISLLPKVRGRRSYVRMRARNAQ